MDHDDIEFLPMPLAKRARFVPEVDFKALEAEVVRLIGLRREAESERDQARMVLAKVRDRFFPADQPERDRDLMWEEVNTALKKSSP
jgi:hypothetical protein